VKNNAKPFRVNQRSVPINILVLVFLHCLLLSSGPTSAASQAEIHVANVSPTGWRRTADGWERAEMWSVTIARSPHDIDGWIAIEKSRQSTLARLLLEGLYGVHPLAYSALLVAAVFTIVIVAERQSICKQNDFGKTNGTS
jgi:hypothetical protein